MSDATVAQLIQQLQEQRRFWVTLTEEPTRKVQVTRPTAAQKAVLEGKAGMARYEAFADPVLDWKGFTTADLGGEGPDRLPFSRAAWNAVWVDRMDWLSTVAESATTAFIDHLTAQGEAEKN